jgi:hypothetical protein
MRFLDIVKRTPPGLALLLLAPVLGELVSAHQTPLEFINPLNFLILSLPYGFGALICRELFTSRGKGLLCLLLLGISYGIYEEGIVVHSFFNPIWAELGALARYSYFAGVNWTWSELMVHFHTFVSIGSSVMLIEIIYPEQRHQSWLNGKTMAVCTLGLIAWIPLGFLMTDYFPPLGWYALSWAVFVFLVLAAYFLPPLPSPSLKRKVPNPVFFFLLGLVNITAFFLTVFLTPEPGTPPLAVTTLLLLIFDGITLWLILRWSGNGYNWDDRHRFALIAGFLGFFVYFCFAKDLESWQGTSITGLATIIGMWMLGRSVLRRRKSQQLKEFPDDKAALPQG